MMPALLTRMSSGPSQASVKALTDLRSDRSRALMSMAWLPADRRSSAATGSATSTRRTAIVTKAPAPAKERTGSAPTPARPPAASDDRFSPGQVDARDDFRRRRLESKVGGEPRHCSDEDSSLRALRRLKSVLGVRAA